ncbi:GntR family transcriptional regulator [[Clostridium] fimetarium]|uniref:DNA-binding transcriptional regulator YhcF, GntR family n=1 Tax=[Clostridium] fimetarium TaxID=99656 RepID=A0A1I0PGR5_9FIRM|nr:GntR family transcriptional regulator [[Clostridium] fimetarium]SEW13631.1 DNA-binding transcriptional regulator YhcF, GntR family [[Clostridium] fimetarium]
MILKIDMSNDIPIYQQIRNQIVFGVAKGELKYGDSLPTVRQLAADIGVNPMTVNRAYSILKNEGTIIIDRRHGAKISLKSLDSTTFDIDFDQRAILLISEASTRGATKEELTEHISKLIDIVYQT